MTRSRVEGHIESILARAAREHARQGMGVALLPLAALHVADRADFVIRKLSDQVGVPEYLIHRTTELNAAQHAMKQALQRATRTHQREVQRAWKGLL